MVIEKTLDPKKAPTYALYAKLMEWADRFRKLGVRTNADLPEQCTQAVAFGAEGVGLCRTEHMFLGSERVDLVRRMILADDEEARRQALDRLLPLQRQDFVGIFRAMAGRTGHGAAHRSAAARVPARRGRGAGPSRGR